MIVLTEVGRDFGKETVELTSTAFLVGLGEELGVSEDLLESGSLL